jgi:hypothetical protein
MAGLLAGLPVEVPAVTVNRLCASGLEAAVQGARQLRLGDAGLVLAGGVESMSRAPLVTLKPERGFPRGNTELVDTTIGWRFVNPRMEERYSTESMGETAENVAQRYGVSREEQDAFSLESHRRAVAAADAGRFDDEIVPVDVPQPKGDPVTVHADEGPRPARAWSGCRRWARSSAWAEPSRRATRHRSTTAPRASCSPPRSAPGSSTASRSRGSSPPAQRGSIPATWGSGRCPRRARRSSGPG